MSPLQAALLALVLVLLAVYVSWTAGRLDRLHARVDAAWAALDAALVRRAAAARSVAAHLPPHAAETLALEHAVAAALEGGPVGREAVENDLSSVLRAALPLLPERGSEQARSELAHALNRVVLARSIHNGAVADTLVLRVKRVPRVLHLAGTRVLPRHFDIDDDLGGGTGGAGLLPHPAGQRRLA